MVGALQKLARNTSEIIIIYHILSYYGVQMQTSCKPHCAVITRLFGPSEPVWRRVWPCYCSRSWCKAVTIWLCKRSKQNVLLDVKEPHCNLCILWDVDISQWTSQNYPNLTSRPGLCRLCHGYVGRCACRLASCASHLCGPLGANCPSTIPARAKGTASRLGGSAVPGLMLMWKSHIGRHQEKWATIWLFLTGTRTATWMCWSCTTTGTLSVKLGPQKTWVLDKPRPN